MRLDAQVLERLAPGGTLAARWPGFESRPGQLALAGDIARTLEDGGVRLAEAPTGVGKSLAYLLPAVLHAAQHDARVVVATCTRSLQDQLFERDLPALLEALDLRLACARLKGKQNYVCPRELELVNDAEPGEADTLDALRVWAARDEEGDLDRFDPPDPDAFRRIRPRVAADPHACTAVSCRRARECAWARARRLAAAARLVVVNHALLALSGGVEGLLPEFDVLIVDEAHRLEGVLLGQLECGVSRHRVEEPLRLLGGGRRGGAGLLARVRAHLLPLLRPQEQDDPIETLLARARELREASETLFAKLEPPDGGPRATPYAVRTRYASVGELLGRDLDPLEAVLNACRGIASDLERIATRLEGGGDRAAELSAEAQQMAGQFGALRADFERLTVSMPAGWVHWRSSGGRGLELHGSPVTAGDAAQELVLGRARAVVLTSATLTSRGSFEWIADRLGLGEERGRPYASGTYPTPFPLERQMAAFVLNRDAEESERVASVIAALEVAGPRNTLALFTAHERMRHAQQRLAAALGPGRPLLVQDRDGPAGLLAERFRDMRGAVLLGVQSLWEGIDFPGDALEILIVAKLPFAVPDDPLVEARGERLRERGLDPFPYDALPEAVLRFRQGVGRLIRRVSDRGVLVVCDPRLARARYARAFVEGLPVPVQVMRDPEPLAAEAARFLERAGHGEDA